MTPRYGFVPLTLTTLLVLGCAGTTLPPALPDDRIRLTSPTESPAEDLPYPTQQDLAELVQPLPSMPSLDRPRRVVPTTEPAKRPRRSRKEPRQQTLEQMVRSANTEATVGPSRGELRASAIMRYDYNEDSIYEVYAAPNAPAFVRLPPGHHLAAPVTLNPDEWVMSKVEMTLPGDVDQQGWVIRPGKAGLEAYINVISKEGFVAKCKVRSFEKTAMLEVSWNWSATSPASFQPIATPTLAMPLTAVQAPPLRPGERTSMLLAALRPEAAKGETAKPAQVKLKAPTMNAERLHTGYTIAVVGKHTPPWVPVSVIDDGSKTLIKFRESLAFTSAPDLFAIHPDGTPAPVEFTPYTSDNGETMLYIIPGLFGELHLKGRNDLHVKMTRVPNGTKK